MNSQAKNTSFFLLGSLATLAIFVLSGASSPSETDQEDRKENKYSVQYENTFDQTKRLTIAITDRDKNKSFLYVVDRIYQDKFKIRTFQTPPRLIATINLDSAGKPNLDAKVDPFLAGFATLPDPGKLPLSPNANPRGKPVSPYEKIQGHDR